VTILKIKLEWVTLLLFSREDFGEHETMFLAIMYAEVGDEARENGERRERKVS
jgi:hypothetical protein